ncbi:toll/interleukin-1 receptor domain-containing protein [Vibrio anguillarum]|uniref:toll/interleukin-1 receptor domain-containing protein n=3 Tax=Vibrio anguillarum TaxID=55601 RepID=UPI00188D7339|nr:toll/interleukin-1 receptor domain-containing protein [Vibrio anguillarum]EHU0329683.1 toll/interleukin-1 receptor domain-containing protein [Vibrio vulnificus]MBF4258361.1 toll/interleukin-1 receptor domain-containing protein [Vibrio anguillarum]MBF4300602.1 toll/interleukin-1 receptor domain-containing protein [Vibrio anguillarum]MBF4400104.1 toll/interleukin-1 receptor domain-containing protein [Vibrio anguillarum]MBF4439263.1 toll/interleukin-1 receptor domain-containing protein [Vibrio
MNVFLSWSGDRSKAVAELLDSWLQCVIQAVDPWMSSKDIDRGSLWFSEINDQLQNTTIGIICLTQENKNKPWILFEAGALAKGLSNSRVCTFLIDLEPTDVGTPLSQFNHTFPSQDGLWELVRTLNNSLKDKGLKEKTLELVFETYWPKFESEFNEILNMTPQAGEAHKRSEDEILLEILNSTRSMERRIRSIENERRIISRADNKSSFDKMSLNLNKIISELKADGLPDEAIDEIVRKNYPKSFWVKQSNLFDTDSTDGNNT